MSNKIYFYLEGSEKKGPFSKEEIIELNLSKETLIFEDELNKWLPLSNLKEFKEQKIKADKKKIKIPAIFILLLLLIVSSTIAYYITEYNRKSDYKLLKDKISKVFEGKTEISDYSKSSVKGNLDKAKYYDEIWGSLTTKKDDEDKELYEIFQFKSGGWTIYSLTDLNLGYRYKYEEHNSTNMGFKVPEYIKSGGEMISGIYPIEYFPSYKSPTYRGTVQEAYNGSMKFLSVDRDNNSYLAGSLNKINSFNRISTKYYNISESESWKGLGEGNIFTKSWIVWYKTNGKHFDIVRDKEQYNIALITNISIAVGLSLLIFLIWKYGNRISIGK